MKKQIIAALQKMGIKVENDHIRRSDILAALHIIKATGEMYAEDLEPGGEFYEAAKELEDVGLQTGVFDSVKPFDTYQGPYAALKTGDRIWLTDEPGVYFLELLAPGKMRGQGFEAEAEEIAQFYAGIEKHKPAYKHLRLVKSSLNDMALEIARVWACDQIASAAQDTPYSREFERSQEDVMDTVPAALEDVGLKLDDYLDLDAAKNLIEAIDKEWAGKLTVESLVEEFGDDILVTIALQAARHGVGLFDDEDVEDFVKAKGVGNFKKSSYEAGLTEALNAVDDYLAKKEEKEEEEKAESKMVKANTADLGLDPVYQENLRLRALLKKSLPHLSIKDSPWGVGSFDIMLPIGKVQVSTQYAKDNKFMYSVYVVNKSGKTVDAKEKLSSDKDLIESLKDMMGDAQKSAATSTSREDFVVYYDRGMKIPQLRQQHKSPKPWKTHPYWVQYIKNSPTDWNLPVTEEKVWDYKKSAYVPAIK